MTLRSICAAATFLLSMASFGQPTPNPALLVGEKSGALMAIIDPASMEIVARVPANPNPHEIATDGAHAYISNSRSQAITVIDLKAQQQVEGIDLHPLGAIHSLVMAAGKLYFANEMARTIGRYDPDAKTIDWVLGTGIPRAHMITLADDASQIFATSISGAFAAIIERPEEEGDWMVTRVHTGPRAEGLDLSPDGRELWVANVNDSTISVIDVEAKREIDKINLPTTFSNRLKFTLDGRYVLVSDLRGREVLVLDAATRQEVKWIDVEGGSEGILMEPSGSRAFVAVSTAGTVVAIDLKSLAVVGKTGELNNPDGMAWAVLQP